MNVLVAERSEFQRNGLRWMLENSGVHIDEYQEVTNPAELFTHVDRLRYDLLLVDLDMLQEEEWPQLQKVAEHSVVIGITAGNDFHLAVRCLEAGIYRLFVKPLAIQSLIEAIQTSVAKRQREKANRSLYEPDSCKKQWISQMIFGQVSHLRELWDQAVQLGYDALPSVVMVSKISRFDELMKNKSDVWKKQVLHEVYTCIDSFCQDSGLISTWIQDEFVIMYTPRKGEQKQETIERVKQLGKQLSKRVQQETGYALYVACGNEYKDPLHLYHSYEEAKRLLALEFYFCTGKVCHYSDYPALFNKNIIDLITVPLEEDGLDKDHVSFVFREVEQKLRELQENGVLPLYYKLTSLYVMLKITKLYQHDEQEQFRSFLLNSKHILMSDSMDDILPYMKEYLTKLSESDSFSSQHIVIDRVLHYMNENYNQPITLQQAAEHIDRSPYYLSHLFKKVMNMTFVEYMTQIRIKKAKELLLEDQYSVAEISAIIGYQDPNYFSRVFKAICGVSPKQWKTQKRLDKTKKVRLECDGEMLMQKGTTDHK